MDFTSLPPEEIERRRLLSVAEWERRNREDFQQRYQERCDAFYWAHGPCCAGCDHWSSESSDTGECYAAAPMSGEQVLRSLGIVGASFTPPPGQPYTNRDHVCGQFKDEFDWSELPMEYLKRIRAKLPAIETGEHLKG